MLLILASASPRRKELLEQAGIEIAEITSPDIDESVRKGEKPSSYAARMALEKAAKIAAIRPDKHVLAADTVVVCGGRILPKTESADEARKCLEILSGRRHRVITAVSLARPDGSIKSRISNSVVSFKRLDAAEINNYIASMEWQGVAGGYAIQGRAARFVRRINGSHSAIVGLPLFEVSQLIKS